MQIEAAERERGYKFMLLIFSCCLFLLTGCGLETYYVLEPPTVASHVPTTDSVGEEKYFAFRTNDSYNNSLDDIKYKGTAVYYKIYTNLSTMNSHISAISALNTSSNYSKAAKKMIETYGYQQLGTDDGTVHPLIEASSGSGQNVIIRLTNYYEDLADDDAKYLNEPIITIADADFSVPKRYDNKYSFDFGRTGNYDGTPSSDDTDVEYSSSFTTSDIWYVDMYAVAVGLDTTYSKLYSLVLHLGSISIDAGSENN
ncbi:MAG: hypothetical protein LKF96_11615 [Treponema sp.]|jgi:hypothetical protein|nr:hypothetical protein [Treponema sp.]